MLIKRKDDDSPYVVHPFMVALKLLRAGFSDEVVASSLVHDVLKIPKFPKRFRNGISEDILNIVKLSVKTNRFLGKREKKYIESVRNGSKKPRRFNFDKYTMPRGFGRLQNLRGRKCGNISARKRFKSMV